MSVLIDYFVAQVDADEHRELGERYGVTVRAMLSLLPVNGRSVLACSWLGVRIVGADWRALFAGLPDAEVVLARQAHQRARRVRSLLLPQMLWAIPLDAGRLLQLDDGLALAFTLYNVWHCSLHSIIL